MSSFESSVDRLCEDKMIRPVQAAILRACIPGEVWEDLWDIFGGYGMGYYNQFTNLLDRLGDWAFKVGHWAGLGYLTRIETEDDYLYLTTERGKEALQRYDRELGR